MRSPGIVFLSLVSIGASLPFTEWLGQLSLNVANIPQIKFNLSTGPAVIDIQNGTCHDISLGVLNVADAVGSTSGFATNFSLDGFGLKCELNLANAEVKPSLFLPSINTGPLNIALTISPGLVSAGLAIPVAQNKSAPLPEGASLTACNASLAFNLHATGQTQEGIDAADLINDIAKDLTPPDLSGFLCGTVEALVRGVNGTIRSISSNFVASGGLDPWEDLPEPTDMSPKATDIQELMETGTFGRALQTLIHHGRYDMSNTTQYLELSKGMHQILHPDESSQLHRLFEGVEQLAAMEGTVPFSLRSGLGSLSGALALDTCDKKPLPSPILNGSTTKHTQRFHTGEGGYNRHCGADVNFTLNPTTIELGNNISIVFGELQVNTNLMAAVEGLGIYFSMLWGFDGYMMINDYPSDQWLYPGCMTQFLDKQNPENLKFLGITGALSSLKLTLAALDQDPTLGGLLTGVSQIVNGLLEAYTPAIDLVLKGKGFAGPLVDKLNGELYAWLTSTTDCIPSSYKDPVPAGAVMGSGVWTAVFSVLGLLVAGAFIVQCSMRRRKAEAARALLSEAASSTEAPPGRETSNASLSAQVRMESSMASGILATGSWMINFFLLGVMGLLFLSCILPTSRVQNTFIDTDPAGGGPHTQTQVNQMEFTLWHMCMDFAKYNLLGLAVIIILANIVNPFVQLTTLIACWNLPPSVLSVKRRGEILLFLLSTFKSNLVGTFLNAILAISFVSRLEHPDGAGGTAHFEMETSPEIGFYLYMITILLGMALLEVIAATHVRIVEGGGKQVAAGSDAGGQDGLETGAAAAAAAEGEGEAVLSRVPLYQQAEGSVMAAFTWLFVLATPVLIVLGLGMDVFSVGVPGCFQGAMKWWMGFETINDYSVVQAWYEFPWPNQATWVLPLQLGYFLLMIVMAWFLIIGPVLLSLSYIVCWAVPLSPSGLKRANRLAECLFNWQALEVWVLNLIILTWLDTMLSDALNAISLNDSGLNGLCGSLQESGVKCLNLEIDMLPCMGVLGGACITLLAAKELVKHQSAKALGESAPPVEASDE